MPMCHKALTTSFMTVSNANATHVAPASWTFGTQLHLVGVWSIAVPSSCSRHGCLHAHAARRPAWLRSSQARLQARCCRCARADELVGLHCAARGEWQGAQHGATCKCKILQCCCPIRNRLDVAVMYAALHLKSMHAQSARE